MSTLHTAELFPSWKEEVNRRVADHRSRRQASAQEEAAGTAALHAPTGRAARAASRVAERFASAPSYSQMLAEEARAAMRAAQAAQKAAAQAHAAAQMVLAGLEAASLPEPSTQMDRASTAADPQAAATWQSDSDPFAKMRLEPLPDVATARNSPWAGEFDAAEKTQLLLTNLIQFPREMVAARRMRPRRAEGPLAALEAAAQLSIFEVDPAAVSTLPAEPIAEPLAAPEWMRPEWPAADVDMLEQEKPIAAPAAHAAESQVVDLAPLSRRLLAIAIDGSLTLAATLGVLALSASAGILLRRPRAFEVVAALVLLLVCTAYHALFSAVAKATPGMAYAGLGLCTLDGRVATREQRLRRLLVLPLSVLPLGLGFAWSLFDEDGLTWHDRLSRSYLRLR